MSGVAALLSLDGSPVREEEWGPMAVKLGEGGGDREWQWTPPGEPVALLRALDELTPSDLFARGLATAGDWMLVGDLRLDARDDLARSLGLQPAEANALPDEQLFVLALEKWGEAAPDRIFGGFAVIAWERSRRRLHLWRDANGEKPLYVQRGPHRISVGSRLPILLARPGARPDVDLTGLFNFMGARRQPEQTALAGITALRAARHHVFTAEGNESVRTFWEPPDVWEWTRREVERPVERFREVFAGAIGDRLRSLGAKGGFCSGGLDSTSISAMAARHLAERGENFLTWTSVPHPDWKEPERSARWVDDERPYVKALVRRHPNIKASFVAVDGSIFLDALAEIFRETASPGANLSNLVWGQSIRKLHREAGGRVPFVGGGGNGSISLDSEVIWDFFRAGRLDLLAEEWAAGPRGFLQSCRALLRASLGRGVAPTMLFAHPKAFAGSRPPRRTFPSLAAARLRFEGITAGGVGAGYAGLPRLDPTRDRRVVEFCRLLPPQEFRRGPERRRLIRRAMEDVLPDEIRLRTTRGAQSPDVWMHWNRRLDDLRAATEFVAEDALCRELIDVDALRKILREWPGRYNPREHSTLMVFEKTLATGLYLRWMRDGLDELPGARPLNYLLLD